MKSIFQALLIILSISTAQAEDQYRDYLNRVESYKNWFRIGSYQLQDGKKKRHVDLYYSDSDFRPDGKKLLAKTIPNGFGLYCVWKKDDGEWTHKEVAGRARVGFSKIITTEESHLVVELYVKRIYRNNIAEDRKRWKAILQGDLDDGFQLKLFFANGQPNTTKIKMQNKTQ